MASTYDLKSSLPNKALNEDGTITDLLGNPINNSVPEYDNKPALPNKWLNPDGSYSTLLELISGAIDTNIFVPVDTLPSSGDEKKIYLVPNNNGGFDEYRWTGSEWDIIGMFEFDLSNYLSKNNTSSYTPTGDYNPATKKYVDDSISSSITTALNGSY